MLQETNWIQAKMPESYSKKEVSLYLYFGKVTTEQKEGNCIEHVQVTPSWSIPLTGKSELPEVSAFFLLPDPFKYLVWRGLCDV